MFCASLFLTGIIRRYSLARNIIDIPNQRSSHHMPTPRGGGIAFVICFYVALLALYMFGLVSLQLSTVFFLSGALISGFGFYDDHGHAPVYLRLLGQLLAACILVLCIGSIPDLNLYAWGLSAKWVLNALSVFYIIWMINLYNFMDGINGLASIEAISVCIGMSFLYWLSGHQEQMFLLLMLSGAVAGFMRWNFPTARIFMGDVGSGFLGLMIAGLSLEIAQVDSQLFSSWLILLGVFIVDATVTIVRRALLKDRIFEAHCSHAYQHAAKQHQSHTWVTMGALSLNTLWLFPIAFCVAIGCLNNVLGLLLAYMPLVFIALYYRAGKSW